MGSSIRLARVDSPSVPSRLDTNDIKTAVALSDQEMTPIGKEAAIAGSAIELITAENLPRGCVENANRPEAVAEGCDLIAIRRKTHVLQKIIGHSVTAILGVARRDTPEIDTAEIAAVIAQSPIIDDPAF